MKNIYTPSDIDVLLLSSYESEVLEFKQAKSSFSARDRSDYCAAIANSGGGKLMLGINDDRVVVGTSVYVGTINTVPREVYEAIGLSVSVQEVAHPKGRVVIFEISHPVGRRIKSNSGNYIYPIRRGESLAEMDDDETKKILNEIHPDFSINILKDISVVDLDDKAVLNFRKWRAEKTSNPSILTAPIEQILRDAGLMTGSSLTFGCLILLAKHDILLKYAPQAEIIYEWRGDEKQNHHDYRKSWIEPYFGIYDEVWEIINARNLRTPLQDGFIQREILAFDKGACREAVNNAIAHRDYTISTASVFILASPQMLSVTSPGGFLSGITPKNILEVGPQWRNRLIADALEHANLVERSGQGIDLIYETSIRQGKGLPNFIGTDLYTVCINIPAIVEDAGFVKFLEKISNEKQISLSLEEIYELELLRENGSTSDLRFKDNFLKIGIIERVGKTSGTKYMLSHRYYEHEKKMGEYTRIKGLTRKHKKEIILTHIKENNIGAHVQEFVDAFPELKRQDINNLLQELKNDGLIYFEGKMRSKIGVWKLVRK